LDGSIFSRLTGSGSCIFTVFEKKEEVEKAYLKFKMDFPNLWSIVAQNNNVNLL
jgi:4-diphosphocytidyl-2C-methyl-D-erythritol kinase